MTLTIRHWYKYLFDNDYKIALIDAESSTTDLKRVWPFFTLHMLCFGALLFEVNTTLIAICVGSYAIRMFAITGFYHRYFSHKAFQTSRWFQALFAVIGTTATQRGPLWWAAHHRHHHRHSDQEADHHSPQHGFWQSHCGWFLNGKNFHYPSDLIKDFAKYPELRWIDRYDNLIVLAFALSLFVGGCLWVTLVPDATINGAQLFLWGYCIPTVLLMHATFAINSLGHRFGSRRYATDDDSRNNFWLALITFGEGWHNNHHHYAGSARQGFRWWEVDLSFYALKALEACGLIWNLKPVPTHKLHAPSEREEKLEAKREAPL